MREGCGDAPLSFKMSQKNGKKPLKRFYRDNTPEEVPEMWQATEVRVCTVENTETGNSEGVHFLVTSVKGKVLPYPINVPFLKPEDLKLMIEELIRHYPNVWPDATAIDSDVQFPSEETQCEKEKGK